jgi:hypothetical protein
MAMKQAVDKLTIDLFQTEKRRGRPVTGSAKSDSQRMKEYRQRRKDQGVRVGLIRPDEVDFIHDQFVECSREIQLLRQERDAALKLVDEYRNALHQIKGEL